MSDPRAEAGGLILLDKPAGITSHTAVERARHLLGIRRIGHAGTLDPFATGLLILLVGRATRLLPFLDAEPKVYRATIRFGVRTTTDDPEGTVIAESAVPEQEIVERAIPTLTGHLLQRPPAFSAKRVAGVRAYAAARRGEIIALEPVAVTVHKWTVLARSGADLEVEVWCSAGTYVRALARDLGEACGSVAHLAALRRTGSGRFSVDDAQSLEQLEHGDFRVLSAGAAVEHLPVLELDDLDARRITHGQTVTAGLETRGDVVALRHGEELLAVAMRDGASWRPRVVMRDA